MSGTDKAGRFSRSGTLLLVALLLLLIALPAYWHRDSGTGIVQISPADDCRLDRVACTAVLPDGGEIVFDIEPKAPVASDELQMKVEFDESNVSSVGVRFEGINMEMGYLGLLKYPLKPADTPGDNGVFAGRGGVFACSAGWMDWRVLLDFERDGVQYEATFRLRTSGDWS